MVDYNINGETTLKNGGILEGLWNKLYHEKIGNMTISWREAKYFARIRAVKLVVMTLVHVVVEKV